MERYVKRALLTFVGIWAVSLMLGEGSSVMAVSQNAWMNAPIEAVDQRSSTPLTELEASCPAELSYIEVKTMGGYQPSCIYGNDNKPQVARYMNNEHIFSYAVKFPYDSSFTPVNNLCVHVTRCSYSQEADRFFMRIPLQRGGGTALVSNFTKHLVRHDDNGGYYQLQTSDDLTTLKVGNTTARTRAVATSSNGRWALVELEEYGFVRIDLRTGEYRRIVAPGVQYGYGVAPSYEMAITNDGTTIAITGWLGGLSVYTVSESCGDSLSENSGGHFGPEVQPCHIVPFAPEQLFAGFSAAHFPRFSVSGTRLSLYVETANAPGVGAVLTPSAHSNVPAYTYVSFGDSFSSGEGEVADIFYEPNTNTSLSACHVSTRSYPYLVGAVLDAATKNRACSGSRIAEIRAASGRHLIDSPSSETTPYVSVGVGGNDIGLMGKLKTCLGVGTCEWARSERRWSTYEEIKQLLLPLTNLVHDLQTHYPSASIALVGYPRVVNTDESATCNPVVASLLSREERRYLDESVVLLNKVIKAVARRTGVAYLDVETALHGERLCDGSEAAMNSVRFGDDIAPIPFLGNLKLIGAESFHPTPRGHELVARAIDASLGRTWWINDQCSDCNVDQSLLEASSYWQGDSEIPRSSALQRAGSFLENFVVGDGDRVRFAFESGSFQPSSVVSIAIHSTPKKLFEALAAEDGSLKGEFTLPGGYAGYHTIHADGTSYSNEKVDIYQIIEISIHDTKEASGGSVEVINNEGVEKTPTSDRGAARSEVLGVYESTRPQVSAAIPTLGHMETHPTRLRSSVAAHDWVSAILIGAGLVGVAGVITISIVRRRKSKTATMAVSDE